jgi:hypothetical protein
MPQLPGFDVPADDMPPLATRIAPRLRDLAGQGVYFGLGVKPLMIGEWRSRKRSGLMEK